MNEAGVKNKDGVRFPEIKNNGVNKPKTQTRDDTNLKLPSLVVTI